MNKKEKWTNDVLSSFDGIEKAVPDDSLLCCVMSKVSEMQLMPKWEISVATVAAAVLLTLNIYSLRINDQQANAQINSEYIALSNDLSIY